MTPSRRTASPGVVALLTLSSLLITGCESNTLGPSDVSSIHISPDQHIFKVLGNTKTFRAEARTSDGNVVQGVRFEWSSQDPEVVLTQGGGQAMSQAPGQTQITVRMVDGPANVSPGRATATVDPTIHNLEINPQNHTFHALDAEIEVAAIATDPAGNEFKTNVPWTSMDTNVVTINEGQDPAESPTTIRAVGNGEATVLVETKNDEVRGNYVVDQTTSSLSMNPDSTNLTTGDTVRLDARPEDANGNRVSSPELSWTIASGPNNTSLTPHDDGTATAIAESEGTTRIVATTPNQTETTAELHIKSPFPNGDQGNLVVDQLELLPRGVLTSRTTKARIVFRNTHNSQNTPNTNFKVQQADNHHLLAEGTIPSLNPGERVKRVLTELGPFPEGNHQIEVIADPDNQIAETNETDNSDRQQLMSYPKGYDIEIQIVGQVHDTTLYHQRAQYWENVITSDLETVNPSNNPLSLSACAYDHDPEDRSAPIDDLLILVQEDSIDGPVGDDGGTLGVGGFCFFRVIDGNPDHPPMPLVGYLIVDSADIDFMQTRNKLTDLVDHEIGHALGIGSWNYDAGDGGPWNLRIKSDSDNPRYVGPLAIQKYQELGGTDASIPVANQGGGGTAGKHWRQSTFGNELMTGFLGTDERLSSMTIGSLADQFYAVDMSAAEDYNLPNTNASRNVSRDKLIPLTHHSLTPPTVIGVNEHGQIQQIRKLRKHPQ